MAAVELYNSTLFSDANLQAYWRFEETSGTSTDDASSNSNTGTASRTNILNNSSGQFGNRAVFASASSDKITLSDASSLKPTGNFSILGWIKSGSSNGLIFQSYSQNTAVAGIQIKIDGSGKFSCVSGKNTGTGGTDFVTVASTTSVNNDAWHFVAATYDGSNIRVFVDSGTAETTTAWANNAVFAATNYPRIGCDNASGTDGTFFNGSIDDLALFNRYLTPTEIGNRYSGADALSGGGFLLFM